MPPHKRGTRYFFGWHARPRARFARVPQKIVALGVAGIMLLNAQPPDAADVLEQVRDKVIARLPPTGYTCIATINRSYYRRQTMPVSQKSCDQIAAEAGDVVQARLVEDVMGPSPDVKAPAGAMLTGRIITMEHNLHRLGGDGSNAHGVRAEDPYSFLIWADFDAIEAHGAVYSIRVRLSCGAPIDPQHLCPFATMSDQKWDRALIFGSDRPDANILVPGGYKSTWLTGEPPAK
ncbi:MAG: hypothetical protein WA324_21210 [Bryobacteraceae bacterium]